MRESLQEHGLTGELVVISDGDTAVRFIEALDTHSSVCPDLAIIDLKLPKYPGFEVLKSIRQSVRCQNTTAVVLSSSDLQRDKTESLRAGAYRYIPKPLRLDEFLKLGAVFKEILENPPQKT